MTINTDVHIKHKTSPTDQSENQLLLIFTHTKSSKENHKLSIGYVLKETILKRIIKYRTFLDINEK